MDKPIDLYIKGHAENCEKCNYGKGFHFSLYRIDPHHVKVIFICPECGQKYDPSWKIDL